MLEYTVNARRTGPAAAVAECARSPSVVLPLDTDMAGRTDAFNPAELLLAAVAACMLKGIERVTPLLKFRLAGASVRVHGVRQDAPPRMTRIDYELVIDTDETDQRLDLLHQNVRKFGTIYNTVSAAVDLTGRIRRGTVAGAGGLTPETGASAAESPARRV